jgi:hypothetical protein
MRTNRPRNTVGGPRQAPAPPVTLDGVADDPRSPSSPVAIRITRPQGTEDEFLEQELDMLTRTSVTLLGAQARPQGVVLRFELVLSSGHVLVRGEGRVVGFKPNAHHGLGGLTLRFTRLDSRSKALIDKAAALRERRRPCAMPGVPDTPMPSASPSGPPGAPSAPPPPPRRASSAPPPARASKPPPLPPAARAATSSRPPAGIAPRPLQPPEPLSDDPPMVPPPPLLDLEATRAEARRVQRSAPPGAPPPPPAAQTAGPRPSLPPAACSLTPGDREALLDRLRSRAKKLDGSAVKQILDQRRSFR